MAETAAEFVTDTKVEAGGVGLVQYPLSQRADHGQALQSRLDLVAGLVELLPPSDGLCVLCALCANDAGACSMANARFTREEGLDYRA